MGSLAGVGAFVAGGAGSSGGRLAAFASCSARRLASASASARRFASARPDASLRPRGERPPPCGAPPPARPGAAAPPLRVRLGLERGLPLGCRCIGLALGLGVGGPPGLDLGGYHAPGAGELCADVDARHDGQQRRGKSEPASGRRPGGPAPDRICGQLVRRHGGHGCGGGHAPRLGAEGWRSPSSIGRSSATDCGRLAAVTARQASMAARKPGRNAPLPTSAAGSMRSSLMRGRSIPRASCRRRPCRAWRRARRGPTMGPGSGRQRRTARAANSRP